MDVGSRAALQSLHSCLMWFVQVCLLRPSSPLYCPVDLLLSADLPALTSHLYPSQLLRCYDGRVFSPEVQAPSSGLQVLHSGRIVINNTALWNIIKSGSCWVFTAWKSKERKDLYVRVRKEKVRMGERRQEGGEWKRWAFLAVCLPPALLLGNINSGDKL